MENISPITGLGSNTPQDVVLKQTVGLLFKDILSSLVLNNEESGVEDAFKSDDEKEVSSGLSSEFSNYSEQFVDSFLSSPQGQQILNQIYGQYQLPADETDQVTDAL